MAKALEQYVAYKDWTTVEGNSVSSSGTRGALSLWGADLANQSPSSGFDRRA